MPGAQVELADGEKGSTDSGGTFHFGCVPASTKTVTVRANGFTDEITKLTRTRDGLTRLKIQLSLAQVQADVQVNSDSAGVDSDESVGTITLNSDAVRQLADDPDDLLRQLQQLASSVGADPDSTTIMVDGFRNPSAMPPKDSIASIRINPDIYAPEFDSPPWTGSLIQVFTKPGANKLHGSVFFTDSNGIFNATDPFSSTATPAGKRRYGFDLTGPLVRRKVDFSMSLEKRDIDEFNVVNAMTLGSNGAATPFQQTVTAPQRLWIASAGGNWQITPTDVATLSFSANVNNLGNEGVGGLVLQEAGYSSLMSEYDFRLVNAQTWGGSLLDETRVGYSWKRAAEAPTSTAPSLQVAGFFTGGGATGQNLNDVEHDLEIDDDLTVTQGKHTAKIGAQALGIMIHDYDPSTFNGAYVFGGGSAPALDTNNQPTGQTTTLTALQQYSRALSNLPGGTPTTYQLTSGTPMVPANQWRLGLYGEDSFKVTPQLTLSGGLRYQMQTFPQDLNNFAPRVGLGWSPDKKQTWVMHLRAGLFYGPTPQAALTEVNRLNGVRQQEVTVYAPNYTNPLTPIAGSVQVSTRDQFEPAAHQIPSYSVGAEVEKDLPHHLNVHAWFLTGSVWGILRLRNINAPMVASSIGVPPDPMTALLAPRPLATNENILQYENGGHFRGPLAGLGISQNSYKRFGFSASYKYEDLTSDSGDSDGSVIESPQSSYSNTGEKSRVDWNKYNSFSFSGHVMLPYKLDVATIFDARDGQRYNITTGTDNNGDGFFNDRPSFASAPGPGVYSTPFGLLTTNTVNGNVPRNLGMMPGKIHLDLNASRAFSLTKNAKQTRTLTFNARSANLLNHTNVTAVNTVLSSGALGQPLTAETARRVEFGARFSF